MSSFSRSLVLESVKLLVFSAWRFTQRANTAQKASTDAATMIASANLRCARCTGSGYVAATVNATVASRQDGHNGVCLSVEGGARTPFSLAGGRLGVGEEDQRRLDALAHVVGLGEAELHEDRIDVLLDRPLGQDEGLRDRGVALPLRDLGEHLALSHRQLRERRAVRA